jgi:hypothetical protein
MTKLTVADTSFPKLLENSNFVPVHKRCPLMLEVTGSRCSLWRKGLADISQSSSDNGVLGETTVDSSAHIPASPVTFLSPVWLHLQTCFVHIPAMGSTWGIAIQEQELKKLMHSYCSTADILH